MSDLEQEMEETAERAKALGVSGGQTTDPSELVEEGEEEVADEQDGDEAESDEVETTEASATSETLETQDTVETEDEDQREPGGLDEHVYPNPDKDLGSLIDTYENFNVYVPPEVKKEVNAFYKQLDYEFSQEFGDELDKHWDFYTALFRAVLQNREIVREELGMSESE
ncbi:hypothetical protein [Haloarcula sp. Atlit-120R]|uniref:hypothetical protein n=1 Tax=Haloarcula sp. Atlit-120R TaxID=2282135 RepID=UPI000EF29547|nr:hypothetical protein [Haloarcula sp. Atlit-120R]RLM32842.1 hypothetical protein DVK01_19315 [Haloarcula sp. Atlit-120R]